MTLPGRSKRLPRSYSAGRLLRLLAFDMPDHRLDQESPGRGLFVPTSGGPTIEVVERVDRRFLGHTEIAQFRLVLPASRAASARLVLRHTGRLRRKGVAVEVAAGDQSTRALATVIGADQAFIKPVMALDFTRFDVARSDGEWLVTVELMGASFVSLALPPMRSYVRLHGDQRRALVDGLTALSAHLGV